MCYDDYLTYMEHTFRDIKEPALTPEEKERRKFTELNYQRSLLTRRVYGVPDRLQAALQRIAQPQLWMVLTEPWCGDSAQCLPYIAKYAECSANIQLRILLRDQNLDIMDQYLTNGTRSIPLLVAFDEAGNELFRWGPRPKEAAELFKKEKEAGLEKPQILEKLHLWYGRNRGKALEQEFLHLLEGLE